MNIYFLTVVPVGFPVAGELPRVLGVFPDSIEALTSLDAELAEEFDLVVIEKLKKFGMTPELEEVCWIGWDAGAKAWAPTTRPARLGPITNLGVG